MYGFENYFYSIKIFLCVAICFQTKQMDPNMCHSLWENCKEWLNEMGFTCDKTKRKPTLTHKNKKWDYIGLKRSNYSLCTIGWKWYSVMSHESALANIRSLILI